MARRWGPPPRAGGSPHRAGCEHGGGDRRDRTRRALVLALGLLALAGAGEPAWAQSLWVDQTSLVADHRARAVGDVLTILVDERASANRQGETTLTKDSELDVNIGRPSAGGRPIRGLNRILPFLFSSDLNSDFSGKGANVRSDRVTFQIAVRVKKVLENGNLLVEGRRSVVVGQETQHLVLAGIVRPQDVAPDNTVSSAFVADAEVRLDGRGIISEKQRPGFFGRILDWLGLY
ncbi:MAG: flagellar basal body L-ring protein FlgH [Candidatus Rokubacteria bacterium]|nr:flagellar basal body L-ring protein FlgH [Candidatus Rokubacteria bacterium]